MIAWDTDQVALRKAVAARERELSADHVAQDEAAAFSWEKWRLVRELGMPGLPFPEEWGGLGQSLPTTLYVLEGLGEHCRDAGLSFSLTTTMASTGVALERFGTDEQKRNHLPGVCSGDLMGAHAITEPDSGSDALRMATRADRDGAGFLLNGNKIFVSNGPVADVFVVYARTRPGGGPLGITAFLVHRGTPGLTVGGPVKKMGLRTSPLSELSFDDCRVPASAVLGRVGGGFMVLDHVMKREILFTFVVNLGEMKHRLDRCREYARTRRAFGKPIGAHQAVQHRIVDMHIRLETARKWLYDTAERLAAGEDVTTDLAITKLLVSESNLSSSLAAVSVFGGHGYMVENGLEKEVRNAVAGTLYSGTSDIQYNRIASMLGLGG